MGAFQQLTCKLTSTLLPFPPHLFAHPYPFFHNSIIHLSTTLTTSSWPQVDLPLELATNHLQTDWTLTTPPHPIILTCSLMTKKEVKIHSVDHIISFFRYLMTQMKLMFHPMRTSLNFLHIPLPLNLFPLIWHKSSLHSPNSLLIHKTHPISY